MSLLKGVGVLLILIAVGTIFGSFALDLDLTDAVYWATITGCSVGFGDIVPSQHADKSAFVGGKWFATFYIIAFFLFLLQSLSWASQYLSAMLRRQNLKAALRMQLSTELVASMDVDGVSLLLVIAVPAASYQSACRMAVLTAPSS
jgi:CBS domain containing-hemolysin-like protein